MILFLSLILEILNKLDDCLILESENRYKVFEEELIGVVINVLKLSTILLIPRNRNQNLKKI